MGCASYLQQDASNGMRSSDAKFLRYRWLLKLQVGLGEGVGSVSCSNRKSLYGAFSLPLKRRQNERLIRRFNAMFVVTPP